MFFAHFDFLLSRPAKPSNGFAESLPCIVAEAARGGRSAAENQLFVWAERVVGEDFEGGGGAGGLQPDAERLSRSESRGRGEICIGSPADCQYVQSVAPRVAELYGAFVQATERPAFELALRRKSLQGRIGGFFRKPPHTDAAGCDAALGRLTVG